MNRYEGYYCDHIFDRFDQPSPVTTHGADYIRHKRFTCIGQSACETTDHMVRVQVVTTTSTTALLLNLNLLNSFKTCHKVSEAEWWVSARHLTKAHRLTVSWAPVDPFEWTCFHHRLDKETGFDTMCGSTYHALQLSSDWTPTSDGCRRTPQGVSTTFPPLTVTVCDRSLKPAPFSIPVLSNIIRRVFRTKVINMLIP